ncbi:MAG: YfiR family protein [Rudaea sp.]|nr:YfiR family protein [Rudaea sp.]
MSASLPAARPTPQQYISGFVLYVRWPDDAAIKDWQVCIATPANAGDAQYAGMIVRERPFVVRHVVLGDALGTCQILDLTAANPASAAGFLKVAQAQRGLLIVGDGKDFCSAGGLICLHSGEARGGFEVNLSAVKNAGFTINAKLLMMARQADAGGTPP